MSVGVRLLGEGSRLKGPEDASLKVGSGLEQCGHSGLRVALGFSQAGLRRQSARPLPSLSL